MFKNLAPLSMTLLLAIATFMAAEKSAAQSAGNPADQPTSVTSSVADRLAGFDTDLAKEALEYIQELVAKNRVDQDAMHGFVRHVSRCVDEIPDPEFAARVRVTLARLREVSYSDRIYQNSNLSNQIKSRIPLLIEDATMLAAAPTSSAKDDFLAELAIFAKRFLSTRRLFAGVGLSYSYTPSVSYQASARVDYSPFQSAIGSGSTFVRFTNRFSDGSFGSVLVRARMPLLTVDFSIPDYKGTRSITTSVFQQDIGDAQKDLLLRSTIESTLTAEYDLAVKLSVNDMIRTFGRRDIRPRTDIGIGFGIAGFEIRDTITTDFRLRTDDTLSFRDLVTSEMDTSTGSRSFSTSYLAVDFSIDITDEISLGVLVRSYQSESDDLADITIDGATISVQAAWFPLF